MLELVLLVHREMDNTPEDAIADELSETVPACLVALNTAVRRGQGCSSTATYAADGLTGVLCPFLRTSTYGAGRESSGMAEVG